MFDFQSSCRRVINILIPETAIFSISNISTFQIIELYNILYFFFHDSLITNSRTI